MSKLNRILAGFLVLQLIVVGIVLWPRPAATGGEGQSLFPNLNADSVVGITVTDSTGKSIHLAKHDDGWVLPNADDYPVVADNVSKVLDEIVGLKTDRLVTETSASLSRLKVAANGFERLVELELDDGTVDQLYIGSSAGYLDTHVRAGDQNQVYLTSDLHADDFQVVATGWADRTYFSVTADDVVALTLENANGHFEFEKTGDAWTMVGLGADETFKETAVQTLVNRATSVTMNEPLGKEEQASYGLQTPTAVVTLQTHSDEEGDHTYTLRVGAKDPDDNTYVLISSESPYYVRVGEYAVTNFVNNVRDDFLVLPPTPTPTPEATPAG
jgi:hypothetical protein